MIGFQYRTSRHDRAGSRRFRGDRGATVLEFAVVFPVFMAVVIGLFTGANLVNNQIQVSHAARDGARYGASLDIQPGWAATLKAKVTDQAVGSFSSADVCVALVRGPGDNPSLVEAGTPLDPTTRVVVRVAAEGSFSWVFGSSNNTWRSTSTALWEPFEQYATGGIPKPDPFGPPSETPVLTTADFSAPSTAEPGDLVCRGSGGTNQYAYIPSGETTTTTTPPTTASVTSTTLPACPKQTQSLSTAAELAAFTRSGSGGTGTTLTATLDPTENCAEPITVTYTVGGTAGYSSGYLSRNLSVSNFGSTPAVISSNLEPECPWYDTGCADAVRAYVEIKLQFDRPVTDLEFDIANIKFQRKEFAYRYMRIWLSDAANNDLKPNLNDYDYVPSNLRNGNGTDGGRWSAPHINYSLKYKEETGSVHVKFKSTVSYVVFHFDISNSADNNAPGWPGPALETGIANMRFSY